MQEVLSAASGESSERGGEPVVAAPELSPEEAELMRAEFNANVSDEEDNSWADELSDHGLPDEYYGEEAEDYGDEASPAGGNSSPEKQYEAVEE